MKVSRICLSLLIGLLLTSDCFAQLGNVNIEPVPGMPFVNRAHRLGHGLVAMWLFNDSPGLLGTTHDISGNGNHGVLAGDTYSMVGKFGKALSFDGSDYVALTDNTLKPTQNITVCAWIYPTAWNTGGAADASVIRSELGSGIGGYSLDINDGQFLRCFVGATGYATPQVSIAGYSLNTWIFMVGTYEGNVVRLFINGVYVTDDSTITGAISYAGVTEFEMGREPGNDNDYFVGAIDIVMLWDRVLSDREIADLYSDPLQMFKQQRQPVIAGAPPAPGGGQVIIISRISPYLIVIGVISILAGTLGYSTRKAA